MSTYDTAATMLDLEGAQKLQADLRKACRPIQQQGEPFSQFVTRVAGQYYIANDVAENELLKYVDT